MLRSAGARWSLGLTAAMLLIAGLAVPTAAAAPDDFVLPAQRSADWGQAGLETIGGVPSATWPVCNATPLLPSGTADDSAAINALIASCPVGTVVQLGEGTFTMGLGQYILVNKGVVLRGAGAGKTILLNPRNPPATLSNQTGGDAVPIVIVGPGRWVNADGDARCQGLTAYQPDSMQLLSRDGLQGADSVTVADGSIFAPGMFVLLDQTSGASWQPDILLPGVSIWATPDYSVQWPVHNPAQVGDDPLTPATPSAANNWAGLGTGSDAACWFSRQDRPQNEIKEIASVVGNTVTFTSPLTLDYKTAQYAELTTYTGGNAQVVKAGVEDLSAVGGGNGAVIFTNTAYCWGKNLEVTDWWGEGVNFMNAFRTELRDSYIHDGAWPEPGGAGYAISTSWGSSELLIENNIVMGANKVMVARSSGAGSVVGYNYMDDGYIATTSGWIEAGINGSHMVGSHHILFEGNLSFNMESDDTHGNSTYLTFFRNSLTTVRAPFTNMLTGEAVDDATSPSNGPKRAAAAGAYSYWMSYVGNVLGDPATTTAANGYVDDTTDWTTQPSAIWMLGWNPTVPYTTDPTVAQTAIRDGNWDALLGQQTWLTGSETTLPASMYLSGKPAFFGSDPWPWTDPADGSSCTLPAKARYDAGTPNDVTPPSGTPGCSTPPPAPGPSPLALSVVASGTNVHTVVLTWLAPYDDAATSSGRAQAYDVRYSTSPITAANFDAAAKADMTIAPQPAGDTETLYVNNLTNGQAYYFAAKTISTSGSTSEMSNLVSATTGPQPGSVASVTVTNLTDLQTQIDNAPPQGVVITLAKGDYQQTQTIQLYGKDNITIQGETNNPADTVIRGDGMNGAITHNIYLNASSYVTVKNLTLRDTYYHAIQIANGSNYFHADNLVGWDNGEAAFKISAGEWGVEGTEQYSDYGLIENCHIGFTDFGARDVIEGIDGVGAKGWVVRNNLAENIRDPHGSVAYAMFFKGNSIDTVFENNTVINSDIGISFGDGSTGYTYFRYGDTAFEHRGGIIANNLIKSTSQDTGIVLRGATGFKVYNNTVWNTDAYYYNSISLRKSDVQPPAGYPVPQPTQDGQIINNIFRFAIEPDYGSTDQQLSSTIVEQNNLTGGQSLATGLDPSLFVDAAGGDFHLAAGASQAIGQGQNLQADVPTDLDGVARPTSGAFDLGAYQYVSGTPNCVDGALTSDDSLVPWSGNGGYDASHYDIDLTYTPPTAGGDATIDATTTIDASVTGAPLCSFGLDLLGLTVSGVTVNGTPASFDRIQDAATNMYKLVVTPAQPVTGDFTVAVAYSGAPRQFTFQGSSSFAVGWLPDRAFSAGGTSYPADGGGVGLGEPVGAFAWYPVNATPADKASYTTSLTVPNEFSGVGIGSLVSTTAVGADQTRWTWDEPDAVPSSFTIAAIGTYQAYTDSHTTPGGAVVPLSIYTDPGLASGGQTPAHYMDLTKQLLDWGEAYFGPYQPAVAGYIMKSIAVSYALEVYGKPFYTADWGDQTYIHEFAHQWGGNSVSVADWSDLWLAEGFATYMPWLWNEEHGGATVNGQAMAVYDLPDTNTLWSVAPAGMTDQSQMFGNWNYDGGALALAALRNGIGPDLMQQVMYAWFTQNAGGNVTTQDFVALAESVSGADLTQWAHDFLYTAGKPPAWPAALSYLPPTPAMDAKLLSVAFDTSPNADSPVTYQSGDPAPTVAADQTFWFSIDVQNTGSATWGQDAAAGQMPAAFLARNPDYNTTFGTFFMSGYQGQNVAPGDSFAYMSGLRAPSTPGVYTMTWQLAEWTTLISGTVDYTTAPFFGPAVTFTINVVARTDSPPPTTKQPGVLDGSDFQYVGSFALPAVPGIDPPDEKTFFPSGITLRTVGGEQRLILATGTYGQTLYEVAVPTPGKVVNGDFSAVPQAALRTVFGPVTVDAPADSNGTMWYDQSTDTLYWTNYAWYMTGGLDFPVLQAGSLAGGTLTPTGQWFQPDYLDGAPMKSFWGGVTGIPQSFADAYTGGRTLGLGFGGQYSINASVSWGPAMAAVALPLSGTTMDELPVFNYSISDRAPRDGNYFNVGPQPSAPWAGTFTMNDGVGSGVFIDLPDKQGYVTFIHQGIDRIAYDFGGPTWNAQWQNVWNFYSFDSLGQAATGAVPRESLVPSSVDDIVLPDDSATNAFQRIAGSAFDPATRLLYVYALGAEPAGVAQTLYDQPLVHVYYVTPDLSSISLTPPTTTSYHPGQALDLTGLAVTATYADGTTTDVTVDATTDPVGGTVLTTVGSHTVTVSYTDGAITKTASFDVTVAWTDLSSATLSVAGPTAFSGAALTPAVTVTLGGTALVAGQDYDVAYANNTNAGTATVTVTGRGAYTGTATRQFTISPRVITFSIDPIPDQMYAKQVVTPAVVVRDGTALVPTQDYVVSYANNVDVGTATVQVSGVGNYAGSSGQASFAITATAPPAQPQTLLFDLSDVTKTFGDPGFTNPLTQIGTGALSFSSTNPAVATVDSTGRVTILTPGSTSITVAAAGVPDLWLAASASYSLTVVPPAPTLSLVTTTWSPPAAASNLTVAVTTNQASWAALSSQTWLTASVSGANLVLAAAANPSAVARTATVTVTAGGLTATVAVTQAAATLTVGSGTWVLDSAGGSQAIAVASSAGTGWQVAGLPSWLTASASSGSATTPLTLTATAFTGSGWAARTATITLSATGSDPAHPVQTQLVVQQHNWPGPAVMVSHNGAPVTVVQSGWTVVGVAAGFQPGESVQGSMHSFPLDLGAQVSDTNGLVQFSWIIPTDTPPGAHSFEATAASQTLQAPFTVAAAAPAPQSGGGTTIVPTGGTMAPSLGGWVVWLLVASTVALAAARRLRRNWS